MAEGKISKSRAQALIAAYGADPERWPEAERADALAWLEGSSEGQHQLRDAADLDALLQGAVRAEPTNMLKARLLEDAVQASVSGNVRERRGESAVPASWIERLADMVFDAVSLKPLALGGILAPALALGLWLGASLTSDPLDDEDLLAAFGEDYELWTDNVLPETNGMSSELTGEAG